LGHRRARRFHPAYVLRDPSSHGIVPRHEVTPGIAEEQCNDLMNIELATTTIPQINASVTQTFSSLIPLIAIVIAVPLTFYGIRKIVALFPKK